MPSTPPWVNDMESAVVRGLDLERFVEACRVVFEQLGFTLMETESGGSSETSRISVLHNISTGKPFSLFQCRIGPSETGLAVLEHYAGVMSAVGLTNGYFMTTGGFVEEASLFAAGKGINLVDGPLFVAMVNKLPRESRERVRRTLAGQGDSRAAGEERPNCLKCGAVMEIKVLEEIDRQRKFWECSNPSCAYIKAVAGSL